MARSIPSSPSGDAVTALTTIETKSGLVRVEKLASLNFPWGMEYLPDGRLLITEKPGYLRIFDGEKLSDPIAGVPDVAYRNQGGLLDVTVDPNFEDNRRIYLYFVEAAENQPAGAKPVADPRLGPFVDEQDTTLKGGAVLRAELGNGRLSNQTVIWRQTPKIVGLGHFGGRLAFAPDGKLIITSGERQRFDPAQDLSTSLGKVIRVNSDGSIPADNPYADATGPRAAVWSYGHRNPLGLAIEPATGTLWMHEMGPLHGDELNRPEAGKDYGWPKISNGEHYNLAEIPHHETEPTRYAAPVHYWYPAISPSGLAFYTGEKFSDWKGNAFIGGLSSQALIRVELGGGNVKSEERIGLNKRVRDVIQGSDGSLLVLVDADDGALLKLSPDKAMQK